MSRTIHAYLEFRDAALPLLEKHFPERRVVCWNRPEEFAAGLCEAEYLFALHAPREHWANAKRLRLIQGFGTGVDHLLPAQGLPERVVIANERGMSAPTMAEFGLALVLALLKQLPFFVAAQRDRVWRPRTPETLAGKTLGVLGVGAIGVALAERAHALGMRVIGTQRTPRTHPALSWVETQSGTARVLAESDVVVILLPLTDETRGSLGAAQPRAGAYLVNLARGGIVDEAALCEALERGHLTGAAFDVFAASPAAREPAVGRPNHGSRLTRGDFRPARVSIQLLPRRRAAGARRRGRVAGGSLARLLSGSNSAPHPVGLLSAPFRDARSAPV
jgi:phosphoglycerate dehydrogenase-like enzyme